MEYLLKKKLALQLRRFIFSAPTKKFPRVYIYLGISREGLREYLEKQFHSGMTWENYGNFWCIDHIIPLDIFGDSLDELKLAWNYLNLRPEINVVNRNKSACLFTAKFEIEKRLSFVPQNKILQKLSEKIVLPVMNDDFYKGFLCLL